MRLHSGAIVRLFGTVEQIPVLDEEEKSSVQRKMQLLREVFAHNEFISFAHDEGNPKDAIEKFVEGIDADLLALISHDQPFLTLRASITEEIAHEIKVPLLIFHEL